MSNPKRRWFQIHLSTAVVLMIVAGWLLLQNLRLAHLKWPPPKPGYTSEQESMIFSIGIRIVAAVVSLLALLAIGAILEWRIRRREARKP